jgi:hypothetical protein
MVENFHLYLPDINYSRSMIGIFAFAFGNCIRTRQRLLKEFDIFALISASLRLIDIFTLAVNRHGLFLRSTIEIFVFVHVSTRQTI